MKFERFHLLKNYLIIAIVSVIALFFLPMIGSTTDLALNLPNSRTGWVVYLVSKSCVAAVNVVIFYSFMQQAKVNVKDDAKYIEANQIMGKIVNNKFNPRAPEKWSREQYVRKGGLILITSVLGCVSLTQAILTFDWVTMLTYLFVIISGLIFGIIQMSSAEEYWTGEYWQYAKLIEKRLGMVKKEPVKQTDDCVRDNWGTDLLEPVNCTSYTCINS